MRQIPRALTLLLSFAGHCVALALMVLLWHAGHPHVLPEKFQLVQAMRPPAGHVSFNSNQASPKNTNSPLHMNRTKRHARTPVMESRPEGVYSGTLREQAVKATADITHDLRFRLIYGFSPNHKFDLAVQTGGEVPPISADEVPPHFQQYVIIEVTIDAEGHVAEDRIVAGEVDSAIQQKLLAAIREFKYNPAKRDGVPIPSQRDIVIHIPS
jgi:TonB family protein